ncbi:ECF transporter S component [Pseudoflavonifractor sp. 524-17]|nr:ECF transporter S component [Pseudoflavonifractor sp. 524-17]
MVTLGMLTGVAFVVMLLSKLIPSVNGFLDFDFKDVVICIGGFTFGPTAAAVISIVVGLIEMLTISHTGPIGLLMNVLATASFCCTASFVYKRRHTRSGALVGLVVGGVVMTGVMLLWNYLVTPIYQEIPREVVAGMLVPVFLPFNAVKAGMNTAATLLLYKPVVTALRQAGLIPPSQSGEKGGSNVGFFLFSVALLATFVVLALVLLKIL